MQWAISISNQTLYFGKIWFHVLADFLNCDELDFAAGIWKECMYFRKEEISTHHRY